MATHDYDIANQSGAAFRTDLNNALAAIQSNNSNSSSPSTTVAYQWWADTTNNVLKIRNSSNNDWVELLQLDGTLTLEDGSASTPGLAFRDDLNTGIFSSAADTFNVATAGVERMELGATTIFNEDGADVDFRIEGDSEASLFYVDAGNDNIGIATGSANSNFKLDVNGAARIGNTTDGIIIENSTSSAAVSNACRIHRDGATGQLNLTSGTSTARDMIFNTKTNAGESMRLDSSGRLLIGTTNNTPAASNVAGIVFGDNTAGVATAGIASFCADGAAPLLLTRRVSDGNVLGIADDTTTLGLLRVNSNDFEMRSTNNMRFQTGGGNERMRLTGDGPHLLLGGTTDVNEITESSATAGMVIGGTGFGNAGLAIITSTSGTGRLYFGDALGADAGRNRGQINYGHSDDHMRFVTGGTERLRIDSSGRVLLNASSTSSMLQIRNTNLTTHTLIELFDDGGTGTHSQVQFSNTNGLVGQITTSGSSTTYATSSDYRLKENATAISDGITRLKTLKPYRFNFKADASTTLDGFFAHEVTAVPEAIIGTKDEIDADKNPVYQGIDQSKLVPLLVAAVQELIGKVETLEAA